MNSHGYSNFNGNYDFLGRKRCVNSSRLITNALTTFSLGGVLRNLA
jgi:hypothetical protein